MCELVIANLGMLKNVMIFCYVYNITLMRITIRMTFI